jgi:RecA-family ATPase
VEANSRPRGRQANAQPGRDSVGEVVPVQREGGSFVRLSEVPERHIDWYWPGRIAEGSVVLLAGDGGVGKSTLAQDLAARMTRGEGPPGGETGEPRNVLILSAEEDAQSVIRPRMRIMGADLSRVTVLDPEEATIRLPDDGDLLLAHCSREQAGLVVVDVGPAFLGGRLSSNSDEDIRKFFEPLRAIAERLRAVVIVLVHLNKDVKSSAQHRIMGGAAWRNVARQVLVVGPPPGCDPRESSERMVAVEKNNLAPPPLAATYAFRLVPDSVEPSWATVEWGS